MGGSVVRRKLRAVYYPRTQIRSTTRWIALAPVWGVSGVLDVFNRDAKYEKASRGAERSLRARKSRRGLRKIGGRSRTGRPCSPKDISANVDKQHVGRKVSRLLRQHAYWDTKFLSFEKWLKNDIQKKRHREMSHPDPFLRYREDSSGRRTRTHVEKSPYHSLVRGRYRDLVRRSRVTDPAYNPMGWLVFLDSRLGYTFPASVGGVSASDALEDLAFRAGEAALTHRRANQTATYEPLTNSPRVPSAVRINNLLGERERMRANASPPSNRDRRGSGNQRSSPPAKANPKVESPKYPPSSGRSFRDLF